MTTLLVVSPTETTGDTIKRICLYSRHTEPQSLPYLFAITYVMVYDDYNHDEEQIDGELVFNYKTGHIPEIWECACVHVCVKRACGGWMRGASVQLREVVATTEDMAGNWFASALV